MRVALVHYWLATMRGGEKVLESLCRLFPQAHVYTHAYDPEAVSPTIRAMDVHRTLVGRLPGATRRYQKYLPLMPPALALLDLSGYDLVISSESGPAKGIRTRAPHLCYVHTPMRYLWNMRQEYRATLGPLGRLAMDALVPPLRIWDKATAQWPDVLLANSANVAGRIQRYWGREARVVFPPVDTSRFTPAPPSEVEDFYLVLSELVPYKRVDLAVSAAKLLGRRLVVAGSGPERERLESLAGPQTTFLGRVSDDQVAQLMARCRAFVFPGEEDCGITPLEAQAAGRPVIAYAAGGALETVIPDTTGIFFDQQTPESLAQAMLTLEARLADWDAEAIRRHALGFDRDVFEQRIRAEIDSMLLGLRPRPQQGE